MGSREVLIIREITFSQIETWINLAVSSVTIVTFRQNVILRLFKPSTYRTTAVA